MRWPAGTKLRRGHQQRRRAGGPFRELPKFSPAARSQVGESLSHRGDHPAASCAAPPLTHSGTHGWVPSLAEQPLSRRLSSCFTPQASTGGSANGAALRARSWQMLLWTHPRTTTSVDARARPTSSSSTARSRHTNPMAFFTPSVRLCLGSPVPAMPPAAARSPWTSSSAAIASRLGTPPCTGLQTRKTPST